MSKGERERERERDGEKERERERDGKRERERERDTEGVKKDLSLFEGIFLLRVVGSETLLGALTWTR